MDIEELRKERCERWANDERDFQAHVARGEIDCRECGKFFEPGDCGDREGLNLCGVCEEEQSASLTERRQ